MMKIKCGYKAHTVEITKDSVGYHCPIIDNVNGDFTFNDPSLENLVKKYKNFVDKKDRIEDDCPYNMSLEVIYKDKSLYINSYNPHTSALVKRYVADADFTPRTGTLSLDKFIDQFVDFVNKKEEKDMKVVTVEDISRIFTELEEKYGKDKAIGIFVGKTQESVQPIEGKSAAQILFEKLQEHQNKEEVQRYKLVGKEFFTYKGFTINIEIEDTDPPSSPHYFGICEELSLRTYGNSDRSRIIEVMRTAVDKELDKRDKTQKEVDKDVAKVDEFLSCLDTVQKQMSLIDHKYRDMILDVKIRRVFDWYKDKMELKSYDALKDFYFRKQVK